MCLLSCFWIIDEECYLSAGMQWYLGWISSYSFAATLQYMFYSTLFPSWVSLHPSTGAASMNFPSSSISGLPDTFPSRTATTGKSMQQILEKHVFSHWSKWGRYWSCVVPVSSVRAAILPARVSQSSFQRAKINRGTFVCFTAKAKKESKGKWPQPSNRSWLSWNGNLLLFRKSRSESRAQSFPHFH